MRRDYRTWPLRASWHRPGRLLVVAWVALVVWAGEGPDRASTEWIGLFFVLLILTLAAVARTVHRVSSRRRERPDPDA